MSSVSHSMNADKEKQCQPDEMQLPLRSHFRKEAQQDEDHYTRIFLDKSSPSNAAWIGSMQLFLDFSIGLPAGKLFDDGHFRLLMISGTSIYLFSFFMLSIANPTITIKYSCPREWGWESEWDCYSSQL
ncbi:hypothetical protein C8J57DRAFT_1517817 [Mycena rebaudengoi]|nr:hypothetical protein C8J57DRAFT_1517817 [Mycena rebaudengoi]